MNDRRREIEVTKGKEAEISPMCKWHWPPHPSGRPAPKCRGYNPIGLMHHMNRSLSTLNPILFQLESENVRI